MFFTDFRFFKRKGYIIDNARSQNKLVYLQVHDFFPLHSNSRPGTRKSS